MIVNLIKPKNLFSITLPDRVKGQYWISDIDDRGAKRSLISVEAQNGEWVLKSNKLAAVCDGSNRPCSRMVIRPNSLYPLKLSDGSGKVSVFVEDVSEQRLTMRKYAAKTSGSFTIGRNEDCDITVRDNMVSGRHARLIYEGGVWQILDTNSSNGTFVNGMKVDSARLSPGDFVFMMGLRLVIGHNFFAINNPGGCVSVKSPGLMKFIPQQISPRAEIPAPPEKDYFFRSPRFHRDIREAEITIDPPPTQQKTDSTPLAYMIGPSATMGIASMSTGLFAVNNALSSGGSIMQAMPTMVMSGSMLVGTVLWPILTKRYEKKQRQKTTEVRQEKYLAYLDGVRDEIRRVCKEQSDILNENFISPDECAGRIAELKPNLWERGIGQDDFLTLRLGIGDTEMKGFVKCPEKQFTLDDDALQDAMFSLGAEPKRLHNVPVTFSLTENNTVGLYGSYRRTVNMLKNLIVQMIALHSYDELKLMLVTDEAEEGEWNFIKALPHFWSDDKSLRFFATTVDEVKELSAFIDKNILIRGDDERSDYEQHPPYYVIISTSKRLNEKFDALQSLLKYKNNVGFSVIIATEQLRDLPKDTRMIMALSEGKSRLFDREDTTGAASEFAADSVNEAVLGSLSVDMANIELDLSSQKYTLPTMLTFLEMFGVSKIEHLNSLSRWKENNPTITLQTPVGVDSYGSTFLLDLHEKFHGPHGLVAGMTGSGKSEFIITYILSMAVNYHPDEVAFILIDYKGGGLAGAFEDEEKGIRLPHLAGTITNLDGAAIQRSMVSIQSELRRRQAIFNAARKAANEGTMDIYKYQQLYRDKVVSEPVPHLFIISDEFAELKTQQPEFMDQLISAARIGRSLGVHLILATQKPNGVVDDQIWSNSKFRVCLKVQEKADSQDMIKCSDAAELSQTGRFYLQVGFNELFALGQSAWCGAEYVPSDTVETTIDDSVKVIDNLGRVKMNLKPERKKREGSKIKQIVAIVKYLSDLAVEEKIRIRPLWLDPIPDKIYIDELEKKYSVVSTAAALNPIIGEYDDPYNQRRDVLTLPFAENGNCLVYGASGNGKTTFLTAVCYSLIKNHTADEVNIYILDFGSETLKAFEDAPQVGGVMVSADEERVVNFLKMIEQELENRKRLFSRFGGDFESYLQNSGKTVPNIVVMINNFAGFSEQFEGMQEYFTLLSRDGAKFGVYFVVTANNGNAVRYKTQQNFKMVLTMQLNDPIEYNGIVGKTNGLVPSRFKGRGLVNLGTVYEFQTAYCADADRQQDYLRGYCENLRKTARSFATPVPVLPEIVTFDFVKNAVKGIAEIPVGIGKRSLLPVCVNLDNAVVLPVVAQDNFELTGFAEEFVKVLGRVSETTLIDAERMLSPDCFDNVVSDNLEELVRSIFNEVVKRNNDYKDADMDMSVLEDRAEKSFLIFGIKRLFDRLTADGKEKLELLIERSEPFYNMHFVIADTAQNLNSYAYSAWYKKHMGGDSIWIGDGIVDQYVVKLNKVTSNLYDELGSGFGYVVRKGRPTLVKFLSGRKDDE